MAMAIDERALERLRDDLLAAMRESEARLETRLEARLGARIDASAAETRRHMGIIAEDLQSKIALVAEGVVTLFERLDADVREGFEIVDRRLLRLETRLSSAPQRD